jgi:gluconolactonase
MSGPLAEALLPEGNTSELLHDGGLFTEGPVWFGDMQCLIWSDIPNDRLLRWTPDGQVSVFRSPSNFANGNTRDREGRLVTCEHGTRRVTRTELDGTITVLADRYEGKRLNSPNDVVVKSDRTIWFTDPDYGLHQNCPPGTLKEQDGDYVFRLDPASGELTLVADDFDHPNGLAFSPDESILYVGDSGVVDGPGRNSHIRAFSVDERGRLSGGGVFATTDGIPDGMRVDRIGNVWASAGPGVNIYDATGSCIGRVPFPHNVSNLTFGGPDDQWLLVTAGPAVYRVQVRTTGAQWP